MKPKIKTLGKFLKFFVGSKVAGITLAPFGIYLIDEYINNQKTINHESIHWKQQLEMLIVFFYLWYLIEWIIKLFTVTLLKPGSPSAYRALSFEREAYKNAMNPDYLQNRKPYSWIKYISMR